LRDLLKISCLILFQTSGKLLASPGQMGPKDASLSADVIKSVREEVRHRGNARLESLQGPFGLISSDELPLKLEVEEFLSIYNLDDKIEVRSLREKVTASGRHSIVYGFFYNGIPFYNFIFSSHMVRSEVFFTGDLPIGPVNLSTNSAPPSMNRVRELLDRAFSGADFLYSPESLSSLVVSPCIVDRLDQYVLGGCFSVVMAGVNYEGAATQDELTELNRTSFSATASVSYYEKNPVIAPITSNFDVNDTGKLENKYFITAPQNATRAATTDGKFVFLPSSPNFPEANIFAQANNMFTWYSSIGYIWDNKQIRLMMDATDEKNINNAGYYPKGLDGASGPVVITGRGGGGVLKNLSLDSDVVAHELGHHMIFRTITSTKFDDTSNVKNHSGAIHEGMADFFAYAKSGDSCLGESICPPNTTMCVVDNCLRTAKLSTTEWNYESSFYKEQPAEAVHIKGMLVAAFMWDAMSQSDNRNEFSKVALNSIDYLKSPASNYTDLVLALVSSDRELYSSKFCEAIKSSAKARGLVSAANAIGDCAAPKVATKSNTSAPIVGGTSTNGGTAGTAPPAKKPFKQSSSSGCSAGGQNLSNLFNLLLLLPLFYQRSRKW
jgi:hypothetical protein